MDRDWALRPTEALGRMLPRLQKVVDRTASNLGRVSVPGGPRRTLAVLSFLAPATLAFAADDSQAHANRG
eukprot:5919365-Pleurochrysis_carterae.AAC.1